MLYRVDFTDVGVRILVAHKQLEVRERGLRGTARFWGRLNKGVTQNRSGEVMMRVEEV